MKTVTAEELRALTARVFEGRGLSKRDSRITADCLVHANLRGTDSHGVMRVPVRKSLIGLVLTQTDRGVVPVGGRASFCGTNPICVAIPSRAGPPIVLDMATSTVAAGHVFKARAENREIPPTWALDEDGNPTTDPHKAVYWTPAGGAKGYGLGVIVDILTGILSGGAYGPHVPVMYGDYDSKRKLCHLAAAIDPTRFGGSGTFLDQVTRMVDELHEVPTAPGVERVLAPGDPEFMTETERSKNGIPLSEDVWNDLLTLAPAAEFRNVVS